jgi:hypothetical protein
MKIEDKFKKWVIYFIIFYWGLAFNKVIEIIVLLFSNEGK